MRPAGLLIRHFDPPVVQVDVNELKKALWAAIQTGAQRQSALPFAALLAHVVATGGAAGSDGVSVHLCFICLLHLANEHGLELHDAADLASLTVTHLPAS